MHSVLVFFFFSLGAYLAGHDLHALGMGYFPLLAAHTSIGKTTHTHAHARRLVVEVLAISLLRSSSSSSSSSSSPFSFTQDALRHSLDRVDGGGGGGGDSD